MKREGFDFEAGELLLIDKPSGWTSFDVVNKIRYAIKVKKVGHAGTLDPLATGLLLVCTGKKTKTINSLQGLDKTYIAEITLGAETKSYDREQEPYNHKSTDHITEEDVRQALEKLSGDILQHPPLYSAIRINGKRAYKIAREGKEKIMPPRQVTIHKFNLMNFAPPKLTALIECSTGTYVRSLAHDLGQILTTGAYLSDLQRTKVGQYALSDAISIAGFIHSLK